MYTSYKIELVSLTLKACMTCQRDGIECEGYGTRIHWKATVDDSDRSSNSSLSIGNDTIRRRMALNDDFVTASHFERYRMSPVLLALLSPIIKIAG